MDLRRLDLFLAVIDHGGFTAAATAIHIAQPAISLAVKQLEAELGAPLLVRSRGGVTLTPAGEALLGPARQARRDIDTAKAAVAAVTGLVAGRLDVSALPTLAADPLAAMTGRFRSSFPHVVVRLTAPEGVYALADSVRCGDSEIGLGEAGSANDGLEEIVVGDQELFAVFPPGTSGTGKKLRLIALDRVPLVLTPPGTSLRSVVEAGLDQAGATIEVAVETALREALVPLVLAGAGTTFLPRALASAAEGLGAVVRATSPALRRTVVLLHRSGPMSPAARHFIAASAPDIAPVTSTLGTAG